MNAKPSPFSLDATQFTKEITPLIALIAKEFENLGKKPVKPALTPGEVAKNFTKTAVDEPAVLSEIVLEFTKKLNPYITQWQHPRFFAYYPAATSLPAIAAELLIASLGSVGLQWSANPAATELECVVMDWIARMLHAPESSPFLHTSKKGGGIIQNTAGEALCAIMVAARIQKHMLLKHGSLDLKLSSAELEELYWQDSSKFVVYMSDQTHFSGPKAVRVSGMRLKQIPAKILPNGNLGICAEDVKQQMEKDRSQGLIPCAIQLNFGTTNTCGYDDISSFLGFSAREKVWLHVDAAFAGAALILPEMKEKALAIQEVSDSFNFNGSKWFLCGFDSAFLFLKDRRALKRVFSAGGDYLAEVAAEDVYNPEFKDWSIPLGRRFRSLRIWMVLRYFGVEGLKDYLRVGIIQADNLRKKIDGSGCFKQVVPTDLCLVCMGLAKDDSQINEAFLKNLEEESHHGQSFLVYPSQLEGKRFLRIALGGVETKDEDIEFLWDACIRAYHKAQAAYQRGKTP